MKPTNGSAAMIGRRTGRRLGFFAMAASSYWRLQEMAMRAGGQWDGDGRYHGGLAAMPYWTHHIESDSPIVVGSPDPTALAADRRVLHERAMMNRARRPFRWGALVTISSMLILTAFFFSDFLRSPSKSITEHVMGAPVLLFMLYFLAINIGRPLYTMHVVEGCANDLNGTSGVDDARPVAEWFDRHWPWFSPPAFLAEDVIWAAGWRANRPVLLVLDRSDARLAVAYLGWFVGGLLRRSRTHHLGMPPSIIYRLSLFVGDSALRNDDAAQASLRELATWGWGVVSTPAGVYVYHRAYDRTIRPEVLMPILDKVMATTSAAAQITGGP